MGFDRRVPVVAGPTKNHSQTVRFQMAGLVSSSGFGAMSDPVTSHSPLSDPLNGFDFPFDEEKAASSAARPATSTTATTTTSLPSSSSEMTSEAVNLITEIRQLVKENTGYTTQLVRRNAATAKSTTSVSSRNHPYSSGSARSPAGRPMASARSPASAGGRPNSKGVGGEKKPFCNACRRLVMDRVTVLMVHHPHPATHRGAHRVVADKIRASYSGGERYKVRKMSSEWCINCRDMTGEARSSLDRFNLLWENSTIQGRLASEWYKEVKKIDVALFNNAKKLEVLDLRAVDFDSQWAEIESEVKGLVIARKNLKPITKTLSRMSKSLETNAFYTDNIEACLKEKNPKLLYKAIVNYDADEPSRSITDDVDNIVSEVSRSVGAASSGVVTSSAADDSSSNNNVDFMAPSPAYSTMSSTSTSTAATVPTIITNDNQQHPQLMVKDERPRYVNLSDMQLNGLTSGLMQQQQQQVKPQEESFGFGQSWIDDVDIAMLPDLNDSTQPMQGQQQHHQQQQAQTFQQQLQQILVPDGAGSMNTDTTMASDLLFPLEFEMRFTEVGGVPATTSNADQVASVERLLVANLDSTIESFGLGISLEGDINITSIIEGSIIVKFVAHVMAKRPDIPPQVIVARLETALQQMTPAQIQKCFPGVQLDVAFSKTRELTAEQLSDLNQNMGTERVNLLAPLVEENEDLKYQVRDAVVSLKRKRDDLLVKNKQLRIQVEALEEEEVIPSDDEENFMGYSDEEDASEWAQLPPEPAPKTHRASLPYIHEKHVDGEVTFEGFANDSDDGVPDSEMGELAIDHRKLVCDDGPSKPHTTDEKNSNGVFNKHDMDAIEGLESDINNNVYEIC